MKKVFIKNCILIIIFLTSLVLLFSLKKKLNYRKKFSYQLQNEVFIMKKKYTNLFNTLIEQNDINIVNSISVKNHISAKNIDFIVYSLLGDDNVLNSIVKDALQDKDSEYSIFDNIKFIKNDIFIDIGAHYGLISLFFAKKNPDVKFISLEPSRILGYLFNKSVQANNLKNIKIINSGIGKKEENIDFNFDINNTWGSSSVSTADFDKQNSLKEKCHLVTFNTIKKENNINKIKALKIDCEGCEYDFFENITDKDLKNIEYIAIEVHPWVENYKQRWQNIKNRLQNNFLKENIKIVYWGGEAIY